MKSILFKCTVLLLLCQAFSILSVGQIKISKVNPDSPYKTISRIEFDQLVDSSIVLLETKKLNEISDQQHINIMCCLNTIFMAKEINSFERRFKGGRYSTFDAIVTNIQYTRNIVKVYPTWIPNKGMGYYFPKLRMELYGTPSPHAIFNVL